MKIMVIGIDGASPFLISRWIEKLPNLRHLAESGVQGTLESIVPPASVPAWQCFATGKNPGKIGVFGFVTVGRDGRLVRQRSTSNLGCIWDLCSQKGLKVGVFNVPGTYPPYPINGFLVCGFPVPVGKAWAYPNRLMKRLDSAVDGYEVDVPLTKPSEMKGGEETYLSQVDRLHEKSLKSAELLIDWFQPDLFVMTLQGVDMVQHDFWRYMDQPESPYSNVVLDWYTRMDSAIGQLRRKADRDTYILVMSDHGSVPVSTSFHVNEFLRAHELLTLRDEKNVKRRGATYTKIREMILKHFSPDTVNAFYNLVPNFISRKLTTSAKIERILTDLINNIDWTKTLAFSTGGVQANIYLNTDGQSQELAARNGSFLTKLCDMLSELKHPVTGESLRTVYHFREKTFSGPFTSEAPDLCVEFFSGKEKIHVNPSLGSKEVWSFAPHLSAEHVREGFWSFAGPRVRKGLHRDASILDLAPTMMKLLGIDIPLDLDGKTLEPILQSNN